MIENKYQIYINIYIYIPICTIDFNINSPWYLLSQADINKLVSTPV